MDVVQAVRDGKGRFEFVEVCSEGHGHKLFIRVFRDAMKFDDVPAMTWDFKDAYIIKNGLRVKDERRFNGVRIPASAHQLQEIADLTDCLLMTPKVIDLIWLQAQLKFDSITAVGGKIVAVTNIHDLHLAIEGAITRLGGDDGTKLIDSVGKYWVNISDLAKYTAPLQGDRVACNYGWCAKRASGPGVTTGVQCWQRPGFAHNKRHWDPSQTIRLMSRWARLIKPDGSEHVVNLEELAADPVLASLIHHGQGSLKVTRQPGVPKQEPVQLPPTAWERLGVITLPEVTIYGTPGGSDD